MTARPLLPALRVARGTRADGAGWPGVPVEAGKFAQPASSCRARHAGCAECRQLCPGLDVTPITRHTLLHLTFCLHGSFTWLDKNKTLAKVSFQCKNTEMQQCVLIANWCHLKLTLTCFYVVMCACVCLFACVCVCAGGCDEAVAGEKTKDPDRW